MKPGLSLLIGMFALTSMVIAAAADESHTQRIRIDAGPPQNPEHQQVYDVLTQRQWLEKIQETRPKAELMLRQRHYACAPRSMARSPSTSIATSTFRQRGCRPEMTLEPRPLPSFAVHFSMPATVSSRSRKPGGWQLVTLPPIIQRPISLHYWAMRSCAKTPVSIWCRTSKLPCSSTWPGRVTGRHRLSL
jgi:hypothetical protein